jgi:hypothetical protein
MGMDVYGRNPTNETGEYFQRNVWGWRPLAVAVQRIAPDICAKCKYWQSNDSDGLEADDAKALASAIRNHIDSRHLDHTMFAAKDLVEPARCHQEQCLAGPFLEAGFRMNPTTDYADITVADLLEFAEFLEASGGFSIC